MAASDGTLYKTFSAGVWSYLFYLTLKAPYLLKYKQIQAGIVSISPPIKHESNTCYVQYQEAYRRKI